MKIDVVSVATIPDIFGHRKTYLKFRTNALIIESIMKKFGENAELSF